MRSALVVVDMLNDFIHGTLANPAAKAIIGPIGVLAARVRADTDWVLVYANDAHLVTDLELRVFPPHAMAGSRGAAVVGELAPDPEDFVVPKRFYSAFTETGLGDLLARHDVARVVLVGQHTDCCIRHTAYDAFRLGYGLAVCSDGTTVFEPGSDEPLERRQARALTYLETYYGARLEPCAAIRSR